MRDLISLLEQKSKSTESVEIIKVPYTYEELGPVMSEELLKFHYGDLAHGYAKRYNNKEGDPDFNYAGVFLHNLFFIQFRKAKNRNMPVGSCLSIINNKFGSWEQFKEKFEQECMRLQGSGWVYLSKSGEIKTIHNHQIKKDILILVDMWEHAFQMDYLSEKKKYINNIWKIMDWNIINTRIDS